MECTNCNKRMKTLYERDGVNAAFTKIGYICKTCKKVTIKYNRNTAEWIFKEKP